MNARRSLITLIALALLVPPTALRAQAPVGTAFTYQGQLKEAGVPGEGTYDFIFQLWDAAEGGMMVSGDLYVDDWPVAGGLFTVPLDFGEGMFTGDERWLQVHVRPGDSSDLYTELSPRQPLTATAYALYALSGPGSGGFWAASGDDIYNTNSGNIGIGTTSPGSKLDVNGHVRISSGSILSLDGAAVENYLEHVGDGLSIRGTPGLSIRGDEFVSVSCGSGGEAIHIDEYGTVGIGMDNPSSRLDVNGQVESSSGGFRFPDGTVQTTAAQGDGHSLDAADGNPVDALYVDNDGNVGIGTPTPSYPLHVEGAGTCIAYVRNNGASGAAVDARSSGTAVHASGGTFGLDAFVESPDGCAVFAFNEGASGNGYGVFGETASPDGTGVYGLASNSDLFDSTNIGVHGRADGDSNATGVYGEATNPNPDGTTYGVRGVSAEGTGVRGENTYTGNYGTLGTSESGAYGRAVGEYDVGVRGEHLNSGNFGSLGARDVAVYGWGVGYGTGVYGVSAEGHGVRGEQTGSGNCGALGGDQYGVEGYGNSAGGHFEDADGTSSVDVAWGYYGINAEGSLGGAVFRDSDGSANADIAHGDRGLRAGGAEYGGLFHDTDGSGQAYVGYGDHGIEASGDEMGGYFEDTNGTGRAYVGYDNSGIRAYGDSMGGYFQDTDASGYARVGYGDRGIEARGDDAGGYFEDSDGSGHAYVAYGHRGIEARGNDAGGYFQDTNGSGRAYVAYGDRGIEAEGSAMGGYFGDSDSSGFAYVGYGDRGIYAVGYLYGIEGRGDIAGGYFEDSDGSGHAHVGHGDYGIEAVGDLAGGYFGDSDGTGYAEVGRGDCGIGGFGSLGGGYFEDITDGTWSYVASVDSKVSGPGTCNFVQNHPDDPQSVIVYACPEGDEVATYTRGTAHLQNGVARVPLGETFKWVTNPDIGLTAHLTPRGEWSDLYVVSLSTAELVVASRDARSNAAFHYIIYGLRIGFEEVAVVREKEREAYIPSMSDHRALYERRPELRDYNALERFKRMRAAVGQTGDLDLSASQALHDAIVEFDPEIHSIEDPHGRRTEHVRDADGDAEHSSAQSSHIGPVDIPERSLPESLPEIINHKDAEIEALREECAARQRRIEALEDRLTRLEALLSPTSAQ